MEIQEAGGIDVDEHAETIEAQDVEVSGHRAVGEDLFSLVSGVDLRCSRRWRAR
jgi:hypothetical protein